MAAAKKEASLPCDENRDCSTEKKELSEEEKLILEEQNSRLVPTFKAMKMENDAKKHWDLFYKRNGSRFFKDRHWTTREFFELAGEAVKKNLLEIGCGAGNLLYPLIDDKRFDEWRFYLCDISPRALDLITQHPHWERDRDMIILFEVDVTVPFCFSTILFPIHSQRLNFIDICTLVFVLSAIHPDHFKTVFTNIFGCLRPGGVLLFRDYGLYDMAQLRFKPGHKISENFYLRQDGTRSYFFSIEEIAELASSTGFQVVSNCYIHRRTVNVKENIDVPRIFIQAKLLKPLKT